LLPGITLTGLLGKYVSTSIFGFIYTITATLVDELEVFAAAVTLVSIALVDEI
jgi:hypothetical protein